MVPPSEKAFVTVVSGLPRSGTSMMMRMLDAGGIPALTDGVRRPDADNPHGYFEFEPAKNLKAANAWLRFAAGRAVKIVHLLLMHLPAGMSFRIVFMRRDMHEVLASQAAMLARQGNASTPLSHEQLARAYDQQLQRVGAWLAGRPGIRVLYVQYADVINDPINVGAELNRFLGGKLNVTAMAAAVDYSLHRQRLAHCRNGQPPAPPGQA